MFERINANVNLLNPHLPSGLVHPDQLDVHFQF